MARAGEPRGALPLPRELLLLQVGSNNATVKPCGVRCAVGLGRSECDYYDNLASFENRARRGYSPPPPTPSPTFHKLWLGCGYRP